MNISPGTEYRTRDGRKAWVGAFCGFLTDGASYWDCNPDGSAKPNSGEARGSAAKNDIVELWGERELDAQIAREIKAALEMN